MTAENRRFLLPPIINRILTLLTEQGFAAYVVGGAVRDLLLGKAPGDFDVATSARPRAVRFPEQQRRGDDARHAPAHTQGK